jgi:hypothetical protein
MRTMQVAVVVMMKSAGYIEDGLVPDCVHADRLDSSVPVIVQLQYTDARFIREPRSWERTTAYSLHSCQRAATTKKTTDRSISHPSASPWVFLLFTLHKTDKGNRNEVSFRLQIFLILLL